MIILITGATHTGKTLLSQKLLEKYSYPYISIDHIKMGLIRSGICPLSPESNNRELTEYLWNIIKEIIKTAIENKQNLIIEGCYIPPDYKKYFSYEYLNHIKYICIIFSKNYINSNYSTIKETACAIERRIDDSYAEKELLIYVNAENLKLCRKYSLNYVLIKNNYISEILTLINKI